MPKFRVEVPKKLQVQQRGLILTLVASTCRTAPLTAASSSVVLVSPRGSPLCGQLSGGYLSTLSILLSVPIEHLKSETSCMAFGNTKSFFRN